MKYTKIYLDDLKKTKENIKNLESIKNSSILVTGSTGMIGSAIVDFLLFLNVFYDYNISIYAASRDTNKVIDRFSMWDNISQLNPIKYNIYDTISDEFNFDYIIHTASNSSPDLYINKPIDTINANFIGMLNILNYCKSHNVKKTIYISSSEIYGKNSTNLPLKEDDYGYVDILDVRSSYPSSKRLTETLCISFIKEYGLDVSIVRPGHIFGPTMSKSDNRVASYFARSVHNNTNIVLKSNGLQIRSYCYVLDCVSAILFILLNGENGQAYNIANNKTNMSIKDLAICFSNISNKEILYDLPTIEEQASFNKMTNSTLDATKLENLGWKAVFDINDSVYNTVFSIKDIF